MITIAYTAPQTPAGCNMKRGMLGLPLEGVESWRKKRAREGRCENKEESIHDPHRQTRLPGFGEMTLLRCERETQIKILGMLMEDGGGFRAGMELQTSSEAKAICVC